MRPSSILFGVGNGGGAIPFRHVGDERAKAS
jgi:hypothetical protein